MIFIIIDFTPPNWRIDFWMWIQLPLSIDVKAVSQFFGIWSMNTKTAKISYQDILFNQENSVGSTWVTIQNTRTRKWLDHTRRWNVVREQVNNINRLYHTIQPFYLYCTVLLSNKCTFAPLVQSVYPLLIHALQQHVKMIQQSKVGTCLTKRDEGGNIGLKPLKQFFITSGQTFQKH